MMDDLPAGTSRKICLCLNVTDREIAEAYAAGNKSLAQIRATTSACTRCFGCEADLTYFLDDVLAKGKYVPPRQGLRANLLLLAKRFHAYRLAQRFYHRQVRWRIQPMVFASIIVERADLHSRVALANINAQPGASDFDDVDLTVQLIDHTGALVYDQGHRVRRDQTLLLEARTLIGNRGDGADFLGTIVVRGKRRHIGSLRPYTHYYNDVSAASTHDQWTPDVTRHHGYCAMVRIMADGQPMVYVTVSNIEPSPYRSRVLLTNQRGQVRESVITVPPYGTVMTSTADLFGQLGDFLGQGLGTLRFENWSHRAMYYFLAHDSSRNTWNVNHL